MNQTGTNMDTKIKVALLVETARGYGRQLLRGIVNYSKAHGPWSFHITPGDLMQRLPSLKKWRPDGIIARVETISLAKEIAQSGIPTIALEPPQELIDSILKKSIVSQVNPSALKIIELAVEHLRGKGIREFGFCGYSDITWSQLREDAFTKSLKGSSFHIYQQPKQKQNRLWEKEQNILEKWLKKLPKPIGIIACNDIRAHEILQACRLSGLDVPNEIALVGVDNDDLICELCNPPLTSVDMNGQWAGFEAAKLLDKMIRGKIHKPRKLIIDPLGLVERQSTNMLAIEDREVANALKFIYENFHQPFQVSDLLQVVPLCRRTLEMRFKKAIGRSIYDEIQRTRIVNAKRLLLETDWQVTRIAAASGFGSPNHMNSVFVKKIDMTPTQYRSRRLIPNKRISHFVL